MIARCMRSLKPGRLDDDFHPSSSDDGETGVIVGERSGLADAVRRATLVDTRYFTAEKGKQVRRLFAAIIMSLFVSIVALSQVDWEECQDHPQVNRFQGLAWTNAVENDFNWVNFTMPGKNTKMPLLRGGKLPWKADDSCAGTLTMPCPKPAPRVY